MVNKYSIFFGDASLAFSYNSLDHYRTLSLDCLAQEQPFNAFYKKLELQDLVLLRQVHETQGLVVTYATKEYQRPFTYTADFSITNRPNIGLAIATGDCVPILLYDTANYACAAIHAGWRGAVAGVINNCITALHQNFKSTPESLQAFIGPCARVCCYEIGHDVAQQITQYSFAHKILFEMPLKLNEKKYMLDLAQLCREQLIAAGVQEKNISSENALCTICDNRFCSHRRENNIANRQLSIITLR